MHVYICVVHAQKRILCWHIRVISIAKRDIVSWFILTLLYDVHIYIWARDCVKCTHSTRRMTHHLTQVHLTQIASPIYYIDYGVNNFTVNIVSMHYCISTLESASKTRQLTSTHTDSTEQTQRKQLECQLYVRYCIEHFVCLTTHAHTILTGCDNW